MLISLLNENPMFTYEIKEHGFSSPEILYLYKLCYKNDIKIFRTRIGTRTGTISLYYLDKDRKQAFEKGKSKYNKHTYWVDFGSGILNGDYKNIKHPLKIKKEKEVNYINIPTQKNKYGRLSELVIK